MVVFFSRIIKQIGLVRGVVIVITILFFFLGIRKPSQEVLPGMQDWADLSLSHISLVQSQNGLKKWEINAEQAQWFEKDQTTQFKKISFIMKTQKGIPLTVSGESGTMDMGGQRLLIQQGRSPVSIAWGDRYTIKTSDLTWSSKENLIHTNQEVKISGSGIFTRGDGLKIFLDRSELTILGNVHAEIY